MSARTSTLWQKAQILFAQRNTLLTWWTYQNQRGRRPTSCLLKAFKWQHHTPYMLERLLWQENVTGSFKARKKHTKHSNLEEIRKGVNNSATVTNRSVTEWQLAAQLLAQDFTWLVDGDPFPGQLLLIPAICQRMYLPWVLISTIH